MFEATTTETVKKKRAKLLEATESYLSEQDDLEAARHLDLVAALNDINDRVTIFWIILLVLILVVGAICFLTLGHVDRQKQIRSVPEHTQGTGIKDSGGNCCLS